VTDLQHNRALAEKFCEAWNSRDMALFDEIFHPDMTWHVAVTPPHVSEPPKLQSDTLSNLGMIWQKVIYSKQETIDIFNYTLNSFSEFSITLSSTTAEGDRVAVETLGKAVHPQNGRRYDNVYCYMLHIRDGKIALLREYQNTLLVFDVMVAP